MYNLRPRVRAFSAGSVRSHLGIGARAPPVVASAVESQITSSRAMELLEEINTVPDTEMQISDSAIMVSANESDIETTKRGNAAS